VVEKLKSSQCYPIDECTDSDIPLLRRRSYEKETMRDNTENKKNLSIIITDDVTLVIFY